MIRFSATHIASLTFIAMVTIARVNAQEATPAPSTAASPAPAPTSTPHRWEYRITPYLWAPTINGTLRFSRPALSLPPGSIVVNTVGIRLGPNSYLSHFNSGALLTVEVNDGHSAIFGDVIYLNLSNTGASVVDLSGPLGKISIPINVATSGRVTTTLATVGAGTDFAHSSVSSFMWFVGLRYYNVSASADWTLTGPLGLFPRTGSARDTKSEVAGIAGLRGRLGLGGRWFMPLYVDAGASSELTTYQWVAGFAHEYPGGAQVLVWRQLSFDANNGTNTLIQDLHLGGPAIAWTFTLR